MTNRITINIGKDFSKIPAGRYRTDGPDSAECLRDDYIEPRLRTWPFMTLEMDDTYGHSASFLEELFGGLIRVHGFQYPDICNRIQIDTIDSRLRHECIQYMKDAQSRKDANE